MWRLFFPPIGFVEALVEQWRQQARERGRWHAIRGLVAAGLLLILLLLLGTIAAAIAAGHGPAIFDRF